LAAGDNSAAGSAASLQLQLVRAAAAQQAAAAGQGPQLSGATANLLAHPLLGAGAGQPGGGVFVLPRLPQ